MNQPNDFNPTFVFMPYGLKKEGRFNSRLKKFPHISPPSPFFCALTWRHQTTARLTTWKADYDTGKYVQEQKDCLLTLYRGGRPQAQPDRKLWQTARCLELRKIHFALQFMYKYAALVGDTAGCLGEGRHGTRRRRSRTHAFHSGWAHRASRDAEEFLIRRQRIRGNTSTF